MRGRPFGFAFRSATGGNRERRVWRTDGAYGGGGRGLSRNTPSRRSSRSDLGEMNRNHATRIVTIRRRCSFNAALSRRYYEITIVDGNGTVARRLTVTCRHAHTHTQTRVHTRTHSRVHSHTTAAEARRRYTRTRAIGLPIKRRLMCGRPPRMPTPDAVAATPPPPPPTATTTAAAVTTTVVTAARDDAFCTAFCTYFLLQTACCTRSAGWERRRWRRSSPAQPRSPRKSPVGWRGDAFV